MGTYKLQADIINGIYEVAEFNSGIEVSELDDFIYECGGDFAGTIAVEVCELELKGLVQDYGVTRLLPKP